jgi:hypothetical protein
MIINDLMARACGNRTHPSRFWQETLDLKSRRDTRALYAPRVDVLNFLYYNKIYFSVFFILPLDFILWSRIPDCFLPQTVKYVYVTTPYFSYIKHF